MVSRRPMMTTMRGVSVFAALLVATSGANEVERTHDITIDDYFTQGFAVACVTSPSGDHVAYAEWRWDTPDDPRNLDLWVVNADTSETRRLTFDPAADSDPQWGRDDRSVYFLSARKRPGEESPPLDGKAQVWRVDVRDGRETPITRVSGGIDDFQIAEDGKTLYYTTSKQHVEDSWKELRERFSDLDYGHGVHQVSLLWELDLETWRTKKLVDENVYIHDVSVSPDGRHAALIAVPDELIINYEGKSEVRVVDLESGESQTLPDELWREQAPSPYGWLEFPSWSADGESLAFSVAFDGYPSELFVASEGDEGWQVRKMDRPEDVFFVGPIAWRSEGNGLCYLGDHHARKRVYCINGLSDDQPETTTLTPGDVVVEDFSHSRDGETLAVLQSGLTYHRDLFLVDSDSGESQRLVNLNPQVDTWKLPQISLVQWEGAEGDQVEGILELPPDYTPGDRLPLIVELHGGPTASTKYSFHFWFYGRTLLPAQGYALLSPNYRGSTGYGDAFLTDLIGRENDIEVEDILKGVDAMIERGIADPDRLGVIGWSNGGYLANCLATGTDRFKAASSGAGVFDMTIQWAEEDTPGHVVNYLRGLPWERPDAYRKASPMFGLGEDYCTPMLLHVGENDARVPASHARAFHRALRYYPNDPPVAVELVVYPGDGHTLGSYKHRQAKMEWDLAWFKKYLLDQDHDD